MDYLGSSKSGQRKKSSKEVRGMLSTLEGTPAVKHTFVSITHCTVNDAKKKTY
jgi:hypothetical protein